MEIGRPKTPQHLPEVLTVSEVLPTLSLMRGAARDYCEIPPRHRHVVVLGRIDAMERWRLWASVGAWMRSGFIARYPLLPLFSRAARAMT